MLVFRLVGKKIVDFEDFEELRFFGFSQKKSPDYIILGI
jgi:hypothetical protein